MEQNTSLYLGEFDPLISPSRVEGGLNELEGFEAPPETPFANPLFQSTSRSPEESPAPSDSFSQADTFLLIDIAPTPRHPSTKPLRLSTSSSSSKRTSLSVPSSTSTVRKSSPLKSSFSFFEDSFDESTAGGALPAPFALSGAPPPVLHRVEEETENVSALAPASVGRSKGRKWGVMGRLKEEKNRRRSRSLSPVKDWSPIKEGNSSMVLSAHHLEAGDLSLIADEGGSFLLNGGNSGDVTLDAFALPHIGEEGEEEETAADEEGSGGMSQLLRGLGESTVAKPTSQKRLTKMPTSQSVPALSSILPPSLVASSRPPMSRSLSQSVSLAAASLPPVPPITAEVEPSLFLPPPNASLLADQSLLASTSEPSFLVPGFRAPAAFAEPSFFHDTTRVLDVGGSVEGEGEACEVSFLNASTASFKEYRDSPVKPRVVSVQTENWVEEKGGRTPRTMGTRLGRVSEVSSGSSAEEDGVSGSSFDFAGCKTGEYSTLFHQLPPPAALKPESTATLLIGLQSPIRPTAMSIFAPSTTSSTSPVEAERDLLACSTRTVVPGAESPLETPTPSSPAEISFFSPLPSTASSASTAFAVPEGDLLGIGNVAPSPPRAPVVEPTPAKAPSGADRLKRRLEELRAQKQKGEDKPEAAKALPRPATTTPRQRRTTPPSHAAYEAETPAAAHPFADSRPSTVVKPQKTLRPSRSSIALASNSTTSGAGSTKPAPLGRLARPRGSTISSSPSMSSLPSAIARPSTPPPAANRPSSALPEGLKTPGERKESTRARLERLREEKKAREAAGTGRIGAASPEKKAAAGLVRRKSVASLGTAATASSRVGGRPSMAPPAAATKASTGLARPSLARSSSITSSSSSSTTSSSARPSSRPPLAPAPSTGRPSLACPSMAPSSSATTTASSAALRRTSTAAPAPTKLQFSSMPLPRARAPLKGIQPPSTTATAGASSSTSAASTRAGGPVKPTSSTAAGAPKPTLKPRASMIGLGRPAAAAARK